MAKAPRACRIQSVRLPEAISREHRMRHVTRASLAWSISANDSRSNRRARDLYDNESCSKSILVSPRRSLALTDRTAYNNGRRPVHRGTTNDRKWLLGSSWKTRTLLMTCRSGGLCQFAFPGVCLWVYLTILEKLCLKAATVTQESNIATWLQRVQRGPRHAFNLRLIWLRWCRGRAMLSR